MLNVMKLLSGVGLLSLAACGGAGTGISSAGSLGSVGGIADGAPTPILPTLTPPVYSPPIATPAGYVITPADQQPIRSVNDTAEFRRNYIANETVNALYALDAGYTGKGVTVAILDDGVVNVDGELDGRINTTLSKDFGSVTSQGVTKRRNALGDEHSDHGTPVANIIAGGRNGIGAMGFAPDVTIAVLRIADWNEDTKTEILIHAIEGLDYAGAKRIKLVNSSLSSSGTSQFYADAMARFGSTGGLIVNAAGNSGGTSPSDAGLINPSNRNAILFVGSLSPNSNAYTLESYSNRAGTMADRYVVAIGSNVTTMVDGKAGVFSGTSSATPTVTALAADILSKWPQLTGQLAGDVILNTATDIGAPGVDDVFGHGLVDFKAALSPVNPTLSNGAQQTSVQTSIMAVPAAMGAEAIQTSLSNVTVLDDYGRDFSGSIAGMVIKPEAKQGHWLRRRVEQMGAGGHAELAAGPFAGSFGFTNTRVGPNQGDVRSSVTAGSMSFIDGQTGFHASWNAQDLLQSDVMGLAPFADGVLAYAPQAGNSFGVDRYVDGGKLGLTVATGRYAGSSAFAATLGWSKRGTDLRLSLIDEYGSVMGMPTGEGALRLGRGATTSMVEAHHTFDLATGWSLEGYGSVGFTKLKIDAASLVTGSTTIIGSRVGLQTSAPLFGGVLSFGVAQPLTIESGSAKLTYSNGYDLASRSLTYTTTQASLAGERRLQLTAGFVKGSARSSFQFGVMQDVKQSSMSALAGWAARF
ncbi:S8 family peptidase [Sphingomonas endolithica]|uniref:S8 family peptidase n=1 Tax=Sphingomonas endolithica TaxID=2972485 RepID=UPI0021AF43F2|nr:S8 family peptidase [Sphingomonas sp. ZFBP2030]